MVDNQHRKITGYRDLTEDEIALMNLCKGKAEELRELCELIGKSDNVDQRWLAIARTDLQKGFMSLIRSVARPETF